MRPKESDVASLRKNIETVQMNGESQHVLRNRIIVKLKSDDSESAASIHRRCHRLIQKEKKFHISREPRKTGRAVFTFEPSEKMDVKKAIQELEGHAEVEYVEPDVVDSAAVIPSDTRFSEQWALTKVRAAAAWDLEQGSADKVLIGIIDSGLSLSALGKLDHPDLNDVNRYILGTDFVDGGTPRDLNVHGTHVAGIAAAESDNSTGVAGMNWASPVYICRTLDAAGNGSSADFADAVEEIVDYARERDMKAAINYSGGGGDNLTKRDACRYAHENGMLLCAAAGNEYRSPVISPAMHSLSFGGVIAVGSTDPNDRVSDFSNEGPEITVVAPGSDILSTTPTYGVHESVDLNYDTLSGTSMATPLVSGLAALIWSRNISLSNTDVRKILTDTAKKLGSDDFNNEWGHGRVNAKKALARAGTGAGVSTTDSDLRAIINAWPALPREVRQAIRVLVET